MIPPKSDPCWTELVTGKNPHQFKLASAAMCIARNQRQAKQDPQQLDKCVEDVYSFCSKFERLVGSELEIAFDMKRV
jgi:hypothetical protein